MNDPHGFHALLFPHAGGSAAVMHNFSAALKKYFSVHTMELPGRGKRRKERLLYKIDDAIADFATKVPSQGALTFIGHSLGAYLAYMMARYVRCRQPGRQVNLVVISNLPIHLRKCFCEIRQGETSEDKLLDFATYAGGIPDWLKDEPELRSQFLQVLAADLSIADSINQNQDRQLENIPLFVIYGNDDPLLDERVLEWSQYGPGIFKVLSLSGGHFILSDRGEEIAHQIINFVHSQKIN
ncbi:thioesterase II family protein [Photorhabdus tasmaniensis]|uniref:Thioesterase domain-containing protein n=1 Tax=Photorhabdus tasmaniensis TaxID=1004159 RepID=A0ABX0GHY4_9GAMM|nr:alpha/beta fold hydrolase [Photorhabdus tasmaniensis]NHB88122.1 hypothetical protein [Photorhabdus tasmaniensis]